MEERLKGLIIDAQKGNKDACLQVVIRFNPIIKKYGRKLNYDDADSDLIIWLLKTISSIKIAS